MDYKATLNLPRTDFPMKADLVAREPQRLDKWERARLYERVQAARAGAEDFILHDGPPFANGDVHIGNALNKILKDIVVKYKSLRGFRAPYVPGWDCHGLPIEFKVSQEMRKAGGPGAAGGTLDASVIRRACDAYARKYIDIQRAQFRRLGIFGDWDRPYLTLDRTYEADELRLFADIVERGFVYRGKKPVYWCIPCRTALAEAEVEYKDHTSRSIYVKFPVVGAANTHVLIWTTTPWTLPANLAVAYNSTFSYSQVRVGGESYIVSTFLLAAIAQKCRWSSYDIVRSLDAIQLAQIEFQHPFCARTGRLFAGDAFVTNETGTGFVHIAPGHGLEDYQLGRQNGLPIYSPVDDDGRFAHSDELPLEQQMPKQLIGKSILEKHGTSEANAAVLELLRERGALLHEEDYLHSYPHCWRSKNPVIFRAMDQWFIEIDHVASGVAEVNPQIASDKTASDWDSSRALKNAATFRDRALAAVEAVQWIPDWGRNRMSAAIKSRPDWCISRQRTWGVPIPAFYDAQGKPVLDARIVRNAADFIEKHGSNVWFEKSGAELWAALKPGDWTGPEPVEKSTDTLDVWIDSGSSSRAVLMRRPELQAAARAAPGGERGRAGPPWQADMYLEGSDQHRGWFQSSLLISLAGNGVAPYRTVLTHGFMVKASTDDPSKKSKISKSEEGQKTQQPQGIAYEKPQTAEAYVNKWGADILRLWVTSQDFRNDIIVSEERINKVSETYRVIRNALRYQLSNLYDFDPAQHALADDQLTGLDRWILGAFSRLETDVIRAYDACEFHVVYQRISQFAAVELSAIYHDVVKDRLYTDAAHSTRRRSTQTALHRMVTDLCKLLGPILSFTADEAWEFIPGRNGESAHEALWSAPGFCWTETEESVWQNLFSLRELVLPALEKARQDKLIGKSLEAKVILTLPADEFTGPADREPELRELLNVSQLTLAQGEARAVSVARADGRKCERCWHWETDVGSDPEHATLCGRCTAVVRDNPGLK